MQRTELHFIIDSEGNIQSIVKGVKGDGCRILIEDIKKLGQTVRENPTGELYEQEREAVIRNKLNRTTGCGG